MANGQPQWDEGSFKPLTPSASAVLSFGPENPDIVRQQQQAQPQWDEGSFKPLPPEGSAPARFAQAFAGQYAGALKNPMGIMPGRTPAFAADPKTGDILPWSQQPPVAAPGQSFSGMWQDIKDMGQSLVPTEKIRQGDYAAAAGQELANVLMLLTGKRAATAEAGGGGGGGSWTGELGETVPGQQAPVTRTTGGGGLTRAVAQKAANIPSWVPETVGVVPGVGPPLANAIKLVRRAGKAVTTVLPDDGVTVTIAPAEQFSGAYRPAGPVEGGAGAAAPATAAGTTFVGGTRPEAQAPAPTGPAPQQFTFGARPVGPVQGEAGTPATSTRPETAATTAAPAAPAISDDDIAQGLYGTTAAKARAKYPNAQEKIDAIRNGIATREAAPAAPAPAGAPAATPAPTPAAAPAAPPAGQRVAVSRPAEAAPTSAPAPTVPLPRDLNDALDDNALLQQLRQDMEHEASGVELEKDRARYMAELPSGGATKGMETTAAATAIRGEAPQQWTQMSNWTERDTQRVLGGDYSDRSALDGSKNIYVTQEQYQAAVKRWQQKTGEQ